jgi:hypothetical protein
VIVADPLDVDEQVVKRLFGAHRPSVDRILSRPSLPLHPLDKAAEIEPERCAGYAWLRPWGAKVLKGYERWAKKYPNGNAAAR